MVIMVTTDYTFRDRQTDRQTQRERVYMYVCFIYMHFFGGVLVYVNASILLL